MVQTQKISIKHPLPDVYAVEESKIDDTKPFINAQSGCWVPVQSGETYPLNTEQMIKGNHLEIPESRRSISIQKGGVRQALFVTAIECFHSTPDCGYVIHEQRSRLRSDLRGLSQLELVAKRKAKEIITENFTVYHLAYICDTTIQVFQNPTSTQLIFQCPVVLCECTFLESEMEQEAMNRGHICFSQLQPFVEQHPHIQFILFHFSLRYTEPDIKQFFINLHHCPRNIVLWLDEGPLDLSTFRQN